MIRIRRLFHSTEFQLLLVGVGFALFSWPFVQDPASFRPEKLFYFLFTVWFLFILVLGITANLAFPAKEDVRRERED